MVDENTMYLKDYVSLTEKGVLTGMTEQELDELLRFELSDRARRSFMIRIHQVLAHKRLIRERAEYLSICKKRNRERAQEKRVLKQAKAQRQKEKRRETKSGS